MLGKRAARNTAAKVLGVTIEAEARCGGDVTTAAGLDRKKAAARTATASGAAIAATYDYTDADGALLFQKVRNHRDGSRASGCAAGRQGRLDQRYEGGEHRDPLPRSWCRAAITEGRVVAVVEGEKDANSVRALGIIATCNAHGASEPGKRPKWTKAHSEQLRGADIVVLNDNDGAGYAHADATCKLSLGIAKRVRRLDLAKHWPEIPKGGDVSDWLAAGHTGEELAALIEQAPDYGAQNNAGRAIGQ